MSGRPDYDVGDLVVCVIAGAFTCEHGVTHRGDSAPKLHEICQVEGFVPSMIDRGAGAGKPCGCEAVLMVNGKTGVAPRFRKLNPKPPEFWTGEIEADHRHKVPA